MKLFRENRSAVSAAMRWTVVLALFVSPSLAAESRAFVPRVELGGERFAGWTGLKIDSKAVATLSTSTEAVFHSAPGKRGWYSHGFRREHDGTADWRGFHGLQLEVQVPAGRAFELQAVIAIPPMEARQDFLPQTRASITVRGGSWQRVILPWKSFDFENSRSAFLKFVSELRLTGTFIDGRKGDVKLK